MDDGSMVCEDEAEDELVTMMGGDDTDMGATTRVSGPSLGDKR